MADGFPKFKGGPEPDASTPAHGPVVPFTPAEQAALIADDLHAARVVAGLMTLIFLLGLVLYLGVLFVIL